VKFVTPKDGDSVAVVARSVEKIPEEGADDAAEEPAEGIAGEGSDGASIEVTDSIDAAADATIEDGTAAGPEED